MLLGHEFLAMMWIPFSRRSYRVTGCQSLGPVQLRALIDSELGMLGVLWTGMCRAKIERWQPGRGCWRTLTRRGVGGRRGVDLRQGGVGAAGAGLLRGASLRKRGREESATEPGQDIRCQRCKQTNHHVVTVRALLLSTILNCWVWMKSLWRRNKHQINKNLSKLCEWWKKHVEMLKSTSGLNVCMLVETKTFLTYGSDTKI